MSNEIFTRLRVGGARYRAVALSVAFVLLLVLVTEPAPPPEELTAGGPSSPGPVVLGVDSPVPEVGAEPGDLDGRQQAPPGSVTSGPEGQEGATPDLGNSGAIPDAVAAQAKNCDPATGRIRFPSVFAPPCVLPVGDNGGSTYQGVTADEIVVVLYRGQSDPAVAALIRAAGASDDPEEVLASYGDWINLFQNVYETYGRRVKLVPFDATGPSDDDAAARADAIQVATQHRPFAVIGGPAPFVDELSARGVVMITQLQRPQEYFADRAPFVYGTQMSSTQAFMHLAEYIGKRVANRNAVHAGDAAMQGRQRTFGLIYVDTAEGIYKAGVAALEKELDVYGVKLTDKVAYEADINTAQEQARVIIARLKDKGVTSVLFSGDPIAPIFFTNAATDQAYFPEWIIPGGTLVDTNFFGRTYNAEQWSNAFGISQLWIRPPQTETEAYYQHQWFHGRPPAARATYEILYQEIFTLFTAIHLAGPRLDPQTFRDGLFRFPVSGRGVVTQVQRSYGNQGVWPFTDWTGFDNVAEVWWDPTAEGEDEIGNRGRGKFRWVDGGKRYGFGEWPTTDAGVFDPSRAISEYSELPASDAFPRYPPPN